DAARAAGVPGRLRIVCVDGELRVANTGAPLDAAGVAALVVGEDGSATATGAWADLDASCPAGRATPTERAR
ncbi:MAG TPA: hypothetical protein VFW63_12790, partial [Acidimicrobiales bacterium]|nr:hypothetical protein [Acidimicrobiales bacterium]